MRRYESELEAMVRQLMLWRRERVEDARACLAAAAAFREGGVAENSAARSMIERALAPLLAKAEAETEAARGGEA